MLFLPSSLSRRGEEPPQRQREELEHNRTLCRAGRGHRCEFVPISSSHDETELESTVVGTPTVRLQRVL